MGGPFFVLWQARRHPGDGRFPGGDLDLILRMAIVRPKVQLVALVGSRSPDA
jgi:hypothetical protein